MNNLMLAIIAAISIASFSEAQSQQQAEPARPDSSIAAPKMLSRPNAATPSPPGFKAGDQLAAYELAWQSADADTVVDRLAGALAVMQGSKTEQTQADKKALLEIADGKDGGEWVAVASSSMLANYSKQYNEIRIINKELDAITDSATKIDDNKALRIAESYLKRLSENRTVDARLYRQAVAQIGYKMAGSGSIDKKPEAPQIVEYRVTYRPTINGIQVANAGVRLGILASGELVSMRIGGVTPLGKWDANTLKSSVEKSQRTVINSPKDLMSAFYNNYKNDVKPELAWSQVMYAMPPDSKSATVEPMLVVSFSEIRSIEGQPVVSRRKMLGYSLTSKDAAPIDFDSPAARHTDPKATRTDTTKQ